MKKANTVKMSTKTDTKSREIVFCFNDPITEEMKKADIVKISIIIDTISREMEFCDNDADATILAELQATSEGSSLSNNLIVDKSTLIPPEASKKISQGDGLIYDQLVIVENTIIEFQFTNWSTSNNDQTDLPDEYWTSIEYKHVLIDKKVLVINQVIIKKKLDFEERRNQKKTSHLH